MSSRFFSSLTVLSVVASSMPLLALSAPVPQPFSDTAKSPYFDAIVQLKADGVLEGYADGSFKPDARINRAEFLKIILESRGMSSHATTANCFPDVGAQWFAPYVCKAKEEGIVSGYPDGTFKPSQDIAFTEAAKILSLAYKQQVTTGGEWYEGYALAMESSKAIPQTVNGLEQKLTRAEMAEMMWRLSYKMTSQPTKGYLNLKNPDLSINTASDAVQTAKSCSDIQAFAATAASYGGDMYYKSGVMAPQMNEVGAGAPAAARDGSQATADHSNTNIQVEGVDEGDIVKTDGTYLYSLSSSVVRVTKVNPGTAVQKVSEISFVASGDGTAPSFLPTDLYIENGKLVIVGSEYRGYGGGIMPMEKRAAGDARMAIWPPYYGSSRTSVKIYDVRNAAKPALVRTVSFEGSTVSSRKIGSKFYLVLNSPMKPGDVHILNNDGDTVPTMEDSLGGGERAMTGCAKIAILPRVPSPQYLAIATIPLDSAKGEVKTSVILGNGQNVYMADDNLYIASTDYQHNWRPFMEDSANSDSSTVQEPSEQTRLYRFAVTADGVSYASQGKVPGHILNQYSMDQHSGTFRIATTLNPDWSNPNSHSSNNLYTLSLDLTNLGKIENIAPGESIYAARFLGNRVYLVTFKQVDPLYVIDTTNPKLPKILGQLKIPGFSNYLHPLDENHILGIGKEVDESIDADKVHSDDAVYYTAIQGVKLAIFDVSSVASPKEMWKEVIGDRGSETPVSTDYKALLYEPERNLLVLPVLVTKRPEGSLKSADGTAVFQGAYVYNVSQSSGFKLQGTITHYADSSDFLKAGSYWYGGPSDIKRIVRVGTSLITVSDDTVRSSALSTLKKESEVNYPVGDQVIKPMY